MTIRDGIAQRVLEGATPKSAGSMNSYRKLDNRSSWHNNCGGLLGAILLLVISAIVLLKANRFVSGIVVNGYVGAIIAAIAINVVFWLLGLAGVGV